MKEYIVKAPFMCREGQFEDGKRHLCVGVEINALHNANEFRIYLGNNRNTYYDITYERALEIQQKQDKFYKAHSGRDTFIIPLDYCRMGQHKLTMEPKPPEKKEPVQESLI